MSECAYTKQIVGRPVLCFSHTILNPKREKSQMQRYDPLDNVCTYVVCKSPPNSSTDLIGKLVVPPNRSINFNHIIQPICSN